MVKFRILNERGEPDCRQDLRVRIASHAIGEMVREQKEYELASQLWRAGTSIGANVEEAQAGQSRADFPSKMPIAAKEARETCYWLKLARDGKTLPADLITPLTDEIEWIKRILTSIAKSTG